MIFVYGVNNFVVGVVRYRVNSIDLGLYIQNIKI